jgi:Ala-tRNA(Pro) deacylase
MANTPIHKQLILELLNNNCIDYKVLQHAETPTSEDSARVRGEDLSTGGKALVLKFREPQESDAGFAIFVMSASRQLHTKSIKNEFKSKNVRFATKEELAELTDGLVPGSVPPFGRPIVDLDLFIDTSITENETIAFNCGSLTDSIIMSRADYMEVADPTKVFSFSK